MALADPLMIRSWIISYRVVTRIKRIDLISRRKEANIRFVALFSAGSAPLRSVVYRYKGKGEGEEEEDGVEDATLRDSNDPTNNNTKSFRKYRNTNFHRSFVPPSASLFPLTLVSVSLRVKCTYAFSLIFFFVLYCYDF